MQQAKLKDIADIRFGWTGEHQTHGEALFILARHFDEWGEFQPQYIDTFTSLEDKQAHQVLQHEDIIFAGKGFRHFAWCYQEEIGKAVASSLFFVIRANKKYIEPGFLTILFNQPKSISFFKQLSAGSNIPSIRKSELENFEVPILPLHKQYEIIRLHQLHTQSMTLLRQIGTQKQVLFDNAIQHIIQQNKNLV